MSRTTYLALGDSVTLGVGATAKEHGYSNLIATRLLESELCSDWRTLSGPYWTTQNLLRSIRSLDKPTWDSTRVVTLLIGGNDLRRRYYSILSHPSPMQSIQRAVETCAHTFAGVLDVIKEHGIPCVVVGTLYNPLPNSRPAEAALTRLNQQMTRYATRNGFQIVDLYGLFGGHEHDWIAQYRTGHIADLATPFCRPIHPNDEGHQAIANAFLNLILENIDVKA